MNQINHQAQDQIIRLSHNSVPVKVLLTHSIPQRDGSRIEKKVSFRKCINQELIKSLSNNLNSENYEYATLLLGLILTHTSLQHDEMTLLHYSAKTSYFSVKASYLDQATQLFTDVSTFQMFNQAFKLGMDQKLKWRIELQQDLENGEFQLDNRLPEIPVFQTYDPAALINHYEVKTLLSNDQAYENILKQLHSNKSDPYQPMLIQALISMQKRVRTLGSTRLSISHERIRPNPVYKFANFKSHLRKIRPLQLNEEAYSKLIPHTSSLNLGNNQQPARHISEEAYNPQLLQNQGPIRLVRDLYSESNKKISENGNEVVAQIKAAIKTSLKLAMSLVKAVAIYPHVAEQIKRDLKKAITYSEKTFVVYKLASDLLEGLRLYEEPEHNNLGQNQILQNALEGAGERESVQEGDKITEISDLFEIEYFYELFDGSDAAVQNHDQRDTDQQYQNIRNQRIQYFENLLKIE